MTEQLSLGMESHKMWRTYVSDTYKVVCICVGMQQVVCMATIRNTSSYECTHPCQGESGGCDL